MVDPTEPARDRSSNHDDARSPEIVDAELVPEENTRQAPVERSDETSGSQPPSALPTGTVADDQRHSPPDDAEFRQYQQFLEFQKFQEWQRQHGTTDTPGAADPPRPGDGRRKKTWGQRAWWLLRFKGVRRLLYLLILLLAVWMWLNSTFGDSSDDAAYEQGQRPPAPQPILQTEPEEAIIAVYDWVATKPDSACALFNPQARDAFANAHNAPSCDNAVRKINQQIAEPMAYKNPTLGEDAVQTVRAKAVVRSCQVTVQGGPKLGDFGLSQQGNGGWIINSYERPPSCP